MTSFQATLVNAGYGQLALRDQNGKITQKWTLGAPKCVIGAHANCNVRCMLPGIADHHLLLVIGTRQIYLRALAAGVQRDGVTVNELVLSGDHSQLAFSLAGNRFEYSREHSTTPIAKPFVEEGSSLSKPRSGQEAREGSQRLRFTFVQALEKNRDRSEAARMVAAAAEAASERPAWVEEIVREALRPVELRLETIAQPINNLERQLRRQRARLRKQQQARKLSQHAAHEPGPSHTEHLIEAQETIQKVVADQSTQLELVNERVSDILSQLASLERVVSAENVQHQEVVARTSQSGEDIVRLQREMLAMVSALQSRIAQPSLASDEDVQWRAAIQRQLEELHQSLGILDEIKTNLAIAISQNRELNNDLQARWQMLEELAQRPGAMQLPTASAYTAAAATPILSAPGYVQPNEQQTYATPVFNDERASMEPVAPDVVPSGSAPRERVGLESSALDLPSASGNFRVADEAPSVDAVPLPNWWSEDPVVPNENYGSVDLSRPNESPAAIGSAPDALYPDVDLSEELAPNDSSFADPTTSIGASRNAGTSHAAGDWQPTEYELEAGLRATPWSSAAPPYGGVQNDYPELDVPQLLASAIAETPAILQDAPSAYPPAASAIDSHSQSKYAEQTFDEPDDVRDVSEAVNQSASDIELQLQHWLSGDYDPASLHRSAADERPSDPAPAEQAQVEQEPAQFEQTAIDAELPADEAYFARSPLDQAGSTTATDSADIVADPEGYAVSAFSAERLAIEEVTPQLTPRYDGEAEEQVAAPYELPYEQAAPAGESHALSNLGRNDESSAAEGGDESVEDYMRRLLARMRGVSESDVKLPGLDRVETSKPASPAPSPQANDDMTVANGSSDTQPASEGWSEPFDPMKYVPRVTPPEKEGHIDALRELANNSARSAIHVSARRKHLTAIMIKSGVALVGLVAGAALVSINGLRVNIGLVATIASFMVAIIWGYDALATLRPLLHASRGAKSQIARTRTQESEEQAT